MDDFEKTLDELSQYTRELRDKIIVNIDDCKMNELLICLSEELNVEN